MLNSLDYLATPPYPGLHPSPPSPGVGRELETDFTNHGAFPTLVLPSGRGVERNPGVLTPAPPSSLLVLHNPTSRLQGCHRTSWPGRGQWTVIANPARSLEVARAPPPLIHPYFRPVSASSSSGILMSPKPPTIQLFPRPCKSVLCPSPAPHSVFSHGHL